MTPPRPTSDDRRAAASLWRLAALPWAGMIALMGGLGAGYWADRRFATLPWCSALGGCAGAALAGWMIVREVRR